MVTLTRNDQLIDAWIARAEELHRRGLSIGQDLNAILARADAETIRILIEDLDDLRRLEPTLGRIAEVRRAAFDDVRAELVRILEAILEWEARTAVADAGESGFAIAPFGAAALSGLFLAVLSTPADGLSVDGWIEGFRDADISRLTKRIRALATAGATPSAIASALRGVAGNGVFATTHRQSIGVARTLVAHVSSQVTDAIAARNPRDVLGVRWVSVLDARTSAICTELNGKVFPPHEGPRPPAHFNCRSTVVPVFRGEPEPA